MEALPDEVVVVEVDAGRTEAGTVRTEEEVGMEVRTWAHGNRAEAEETRDAAALLSQLRICQGSTRAA